MSEHIYNVLQYLEWHKWLDDFKLQSSQWKACCTEKKPLSFPFLEKIMLVSDSVYKEKCSKTLMNASAFGKKPKKNAVPLLFRESEVIIHFMGVG